MKYESELIKEIVDSRGHEKSSLHYQSECVETWIEESKGAYPKLCDYESEWLNYIVENPIGDFPYVTLSDVTEATVENVVPYAYKSASLKGSTKYRDIDTGEVLDAFEEGRNLELVSVRMPVLTTTGENLIDSEIISGWINTSNGEINNLTSTATCATKDLIKVKPATPYSIYKEYNKRVLYAQFNEKQEFINFGAYTRNEFTTASNAVYVRLFFETPVNEELKVMLYEGGYNSNISYKPYKSNILSTTVDMKLHGIGEVQDTLDCLTGEVTERIGEIVLDGSENWTFQSQSNWQRYLITIEDMDNDKNYRNPNRTRCDKLYYDVSDLKNSGSYLKISNQIAIYNNEIVNNINQFKQWLSQNPITIQYQLATESIKTVDLTVVNQDGETLTKIKPIEGTMNLTTSSNTIPPLFSGEIPVEAITQNLTSFIEGE